MTTLYHYTCDDSRSKLGDRGVLQTVATQLKMLQGDPIFYLIWATDLEAPDKQALGLSAQHLFCDRTQHRYRILHPEQFTRWGRLRSGFPSAWVDSLERGHQPASWWATRDPAEAVYDPITEGRS